MYGFGQIINYYCSLINYLWNKYTSSLVFTIYKKKIENKLYFVHCGLSHIIVKKDYVYLYV